MIVVMDQMLAERLPEVASICRRHRVARLDVLGSAARQAHGGPFVAFVAEQTDWPVEQIA